MGEQEDFIKIVEIVKNKASLKQQIYRNTLNAFNGFKKSSKAIVDKLTEEVKGIDDSVQIEYKEMSAFEFQLKIGGDIVLYQMHTNVFGFDSSNSMWKTSYLKEDGSRNFCGIINIYNFLADSLKYQRFEDSAYLIGRIFINKDDHFFVEGKRQLNFIHNDFVHQTLEQDAIKNIVQQSLLYSMNFDLFTPPYQHVHEISVGQLMHKASGMRMKTAKRVGYKFSFEDK